ncbi:pheromone-binding protein Gp-9-like [Nomia melanderi]|uniref:pheromone-binding protein Gp-9-like n=1 Tax=Nomia melanderi TaxID=2448451 RepID=UPI0013044D6D|nr:uncharacterized protein LOC116430684 [Nomia melanderi]
MKSFLAACTFFLVAALVRGDASEDMKKYVESTQEMFAECATEAGLSSDISNVMPDELSDEEKNKFGCMHACIMKKTNVWDGSQFDMDKMKEQVSDIYKDKADDVMKVIDKCVAEVKDAGDECTVAFMLMACAKKEME